MYKLYAFDMSLSNDDLQREVDDLKKLGYSIVGMITDYEKGMVLVVVYGSANEDRDE